MEVCNKNQPVAGNRKVTLVWVNLDKELYESFCELINWANYIGCDQ